MLTGLKAPSVRGSHTPPVLALIHHRVILLPSVTQGVTYQATRRVHRKHKVSYYETFELAIILLLATLLIAFGKNLTISSETDDHCGAMDPRGES
jgi:hypothetical protein